MPLTDQEIDQLEDVLFSDELAEDTLDYFGLHGLICASVVGPQTISTETVIDLVLGEGLGKVEKAHVEHLAACINTISENVQESLLGGLEVSLPHEQEDEFEACLESWCIGFMEGFFHDEKTWFQNDEEVAAELLLPIMSLSGLFDTEEFDAIEKNDKLMTQFASLVGDQLTDIYLYYNAN